MGWHYNQIVHLHILRCENFPRPNFPLDLYKMWFEFCIPKSRLFSAQESSPVPQANPDNAAPEGTGILAFLGSMSFALTLGETFARGW